MLPKEDFIPFAELNERAPNPRKAEKLIKKGEAAAEKQIPTLLASRYLDFFRNGNRSRYQSVHAERRSILHDLSLAELCEGKGRFAEPLMDIVWATMEEASWMIPAHLHHNLLGEEYKLPPVYKPGQLHGIELLAAKTGAELAAVLYFHRDLLDSITPIICEKLEYMLHERIILPYLERNYHWLGENGEKVNNWNPWIASNVLFTAAVAESDPYAREKLVEKVLRALDNYTASLPDDGGCDEGPGYWCEAGASYFDCLEILYDMTGGKINVYDHPFVKAMGEYICTMNIDGKTFVNFADCSPRMHPDGNHLRRFGEKCSSKLLCDFGDAMATLGDTKTDAPCIYRALRSLISDDVKPKVIEGAPRSILPSLKVATARQFSDTSRGMFFAFKGGNNKESHNHNDVGNFIVYYDGKPVIIDTGVGEYTKQTFSADRYKLWYMQSHYHNLPAFDGVGEEFGPGFRSKNEIYDKESGSYSIELCDAYPLDAGIISYRRKCQLTDGIFTLADTISLDKEREIEFRFMTHTRPSVTDDGAIALSEGRVMRFEPKMEILIEEKPANDPKLEKSWGTDTFYRICLKIRAKELSASFIIE